MSIAQVQVVVDQELIRKQMDEKFREAMFTWDTNEMAKRMCMSKNLLKMNLYMIHGCGYWKGKSRKPKGKRFWFYEPSLKVIKEIMGEW